MPSPTLRFACTPFWRCVGVRLCVVHARLTCFTRAGRHRHAERRHRGPAGRHLCVRLGSLHCDARSPLLVAAQTLTLRCMTPRTNESSLSSAACERSALPRWHWLALVSNPGTLLCSACMPQPDARAQRKTCFHSAPLRSLPFGSASSPLIAARATPPRARALSPSWLRSCRFPWYRNRSSHRRLRLQDCRCRWRLRRTRRPKGECAERPRAAARSLLS